MLVVLDGFGLGDRGPADATALAHAPFLARADRGFPHARLETSGEAVGLPAGQMGNSEVGHMTMGAGRIRYQEITRISKAFADRGPEGVPAIREALDAAADGRGRLHLFGLVSDGGVHSHQEHLVALLGACHRRGVRPVVHVFLDGRDTPPRSGLGFVQALAPRVTEMGGAIATVTGRYWAMDRDDRWDRIARAYHAIVCREGQPAPSAEKAIEAAYARGEGDEFVQPAVIDGGEAFEDGDVGLFFNFRAWSGRPSSSA
jgi:2,3-bisphosphoglycerate-independent phosphoglycerate mutase